MYAKKGLGRGLDAIFESYREANEETEKTSKVQIPDKNPNRSQAQVEEIKIMDIDPNPNQPRKSFNDDKLEELTESIKMHGVVQPIIVKQTDDRYMIVAGERRWRAARAAGLLTIPAISMNLSDKQIAEISLIENLQREDLNPIEQAQGIKTLLDQYGLTQDEVASRLGTSRPAITNTLRLLNLSDKIRKYLIEGKLSSGHGRALLAVMDIKQRDEIAERIIVRELSVRETEKLIKSINEKKSKNKKGSEKVKPSYIQEIEAGLEESLGTKVQITPGKKKGIIEIEYYSNEDLERIIDRVTNR